ncbi:DUF1659 domain-containing protein [Bacillaceae bacterium SIJ1]|uniref:DUF1659 domain-containing protein n=1 Tax=Litoribacterium kuwaitense TaxID=1398745 RepID=UPI0013EAAA49|nr:DUF1659 domain-containing protein [Litoribacterium kuwaitense]NGP44828.1 DUF1659 domain-containing protein [Litoribacterium kuwaitense]
MIKTSLKETQLQLIFADGVDQEGEPQFVIDRFNTIQPEVTDDVLYQAAQKLAALTTQEIVAVHRSNDYELTYEEEGAS